MDQHGYTASGWRNVVKKGAKALKALQQSSRTTKALAGASAISPALSTFFRKHDPKGRFGGRTGMVTKGKRTRKLLSYNSSKKYKDSFEVKVLKALTPVQSYTVNYATALVTNDNLALYTPLSVLYSRVDLNNMFSIGGLSTATNATHIDVHTATQETRICNAENVMADLECYLCVPRKDVPSAFPTVGSLILNGFVTNGYANATDPSINLFGSKDFAEIYKVIKTKKFRLLAGEETKLVINAPPFRVNKLYTDATFYQYKGKSKFWIIRQIGQVGNDVTNKTLVGYTATKLDIIQNERYEFRYVNPLISQHATSGSLGLVLNAEVINNQTNAVLVEASA